MSAWTTMVVFPEVGGADVVDVCDVDKSGVRDVAEGRRLWPLCGTYGLVSALSADIMLASTMATAGPGQPMNPPIRLTLSEAGLISGEKMVVGADLLSDTGMMW